MGQEKYHSLTVLTLSLPSLCKNC